MKVLFLITSVIDVAQKPLSYTKTRSVFSAEQRISQTIETIKSIRKINTTAIVILIEAGKTNYDYVFENKVDKYFFLNHGTRKKLVNSKFKGLGEIVMILSVSRHLRNLNYDMLFKISGRYKLNENFNLNLFDSKKINFSTKTNQVRRKFHSTLRIYITILYAIPKVHLRKYFFRLYLIMPFTILNLSIEQVFPYLFKLNKINQIDQLGVEGFISVNGELVKY